MPFSRFLPLAGIVMTASLAISPFAVAQTQAEFISKATASNEFEIQSSRLAESRATRAEVKAFAQRMIADHTKVAADMKAAVKADPAASSLPSTPNPAHQAQLDALKAASGQAFDTAYVSGQKTAHDEAVTLFSDYADSGEPGALKTFAATTLPTLKAHQAHVSKLQSRP